MIFLALEFSSSIRTVALVNRSGKEFEVLANSSDGGSKSVPALQLIEAALASAGMRRTEIQVLVIGLGPGSYNGVRSAIALAQGWQLAREISVIGVGTMEGLAFQAQVKGWFGRVGLIINAQRNEFYFVTYDLNSRERRVVEPLRVVGAASVGEIFNKDDIIVAGPDAAQLSPAGRCLNPEAQILPSLASLESALVSASSLEPIYLRETSFVKAPLPRLIPPV